MNPADRIHKREELDNLQLSGSLLHKTLRNLGSINRFLGNHTQLKRAVFSSIKNHIPTQSIIIIDLGCGGGDTLSYIYNSLSKKGIESTCIGIDGNPFTIEYATQKHSNKNVNFTVANILDPTFELPRCHLLISSHFIYHFSDEQLIEFLKQISTSDCKHVVFSELYRNQFAYLLFIIAGKFLPFTTLTRSDGLLAIQRAFTTKEMHEIIQKAGITKYTIQKKFWFRMIITITT